MRVTNNGTSLLVSASDCICRVNCDEEDEKCFILDLSSPPGNSVKDGIRRQILSSALVSWWYKCCHSIRKRAFITRFDIPNNFPDLSGWLSLPGHAMARSVIWLSRWSKIRRIHFHFYCRSRGVECLTKRWNRASRTLLEWRQRNLDTCVHLWSVQSGVFLFYQISPKAHLALQCWKSR